MKKFKHIIIGFLLTLAIPALAWKTSDSSIRISSNGDMFIYFGLRTDPKAVIKWDNTLERLLFSIDGGSNFSAFGSGSGSGSGGINLLENPSFEDSGTPVSNWTCSGVTATQEAHSNSRDGNESFLRAIAGAGAVFCESDSQTVSDDIVGSCQADFKYNQGDNAFKLVVLKEDLPSNPGVFVSVAEQTTADLTLFKKLPSVTYPCQGGDVFKLRVESTAAGTIDVDEAYMGSTKGLVDNTGQSQFSATLQSDGASEPSVTSDPAGIIQSVTRISNQEWEIDTGSRFTNVAECVATMQIDDTSYLRCDAENANQYRLELYSSANTNRDFADFQPIPGVYGIRFGSQDPRDVRVAVTPEQASFYVKGKIESSASNTTGPVSGTAVGFVSSTLDMTIEEGSAKIPCDLTNPSTGLNCSAGNEMLGVVFNAPSAGLYEVCYSFKTFLNTGISGLRIVRTENDSQTILKEGTNYNGHSDSGGINHNLCEQFNILSVGEVTTRLFYESSTGTVTVYDSPSVSGTYDQNFGFTVKMLTNFVAQPRFLDMVSIKEPQGVIIGRCVVNTQTLATGVNNSPASACSAWIDSFTNLALGQIRLTLQAGFSKNAPICVCTSMDTGGNTDYCGGESVVNWSPTQVDLSSRSASGFSTRDISIICIGDR